MTLQLFNVISITLPMYLYRYLVKGLIMNINKSKNDAYENSSNKLGVKNSKLTQLLTQKIPYLNNFLLTILKNPKFNSKTIVCSNDYKPVCSQLVKAGVTRGHFSKPPTIYIQKF